MMSLVLCGLLMTPLVQAQTFSGVLHPDGSPGTLQSGTLQSGTLQSGCQPLAAYTVSAVSANRLPVQQAIEILLTGTPWRLTTEGTSAITLSYSGVSGPLDQVLARAAEQAGQALETPVVMVSDPSRCLLTLSLAAPAWTLQSGILQSGMPAAVPSAPAAVLPAGESLAAALEHYAEENGWSLRWNIDDDYVLDVPLPLPAGNLIDTITWVVNTYQSQGGLSGVAPRFAQTNRVVVIEPMNVRESN